MVICCRKSNALSTKLCRETVGKGTIYVAARFCAHMAYGPPKFQLATNSDVRRTSFLTKHDAFDSLHSFLSRNFDRKDFLVTKFFTHSNKTYQFFTGILE